MRNGLVALIRRRRQPRRSIVALVAAVLTVLAVAGGEAFALPLFAPLVVVCLIHALFPTLLGWIAVVAICFLGAGVYGAVVVSETVSWISGRGLDVLGEPSAAALVVSVFLLLAGSAIALLLSRPEEAPSL